MYSLHSRFCPLTSVASGASLFAFDGAATHHPPRSVTDAEQPLIVAHRAAINCAPRRGRSATNADYSPASRRAASIEACGPKSPTLTRHAGVREDSTPSAECRLNDASTRTGHRSLRVTVGLSPSVPDVGLRPSSPRFCPRRAAIRPRAASATSQHTVQACASARVHASGGCDDEDLVQCLGGCGLRRREPGHDLHRVRAPRASKCALERAPCDSDQTSVD